MSHHHNNGYNGYYGYYGYYGYNGNNGYYGYYGYLLSHGSDPEWSRCCLLLLAVGVLRNGGYKL